MQSLGAKLAKICGDSLYIYLHGELGAGKTTLVRGFLRGLGYPSLVKSPTYTLVEYYEINSQKVAHFDLYRLTTARELETLGVRDYFVAGMICLVEWPERAAGLLPPADVLIKIAINHHERLVNLQAFSARGCKVLSKL